MPPDRVTIRKRGLEWQVRHKGKTVYACGSHEGAMEYVAAQLKIREAMKVAVQRLISQYQRGKK